MDKKWEN